LVMVAFDDDDFADFDEFGEGVLEWISLLDWDGDTRLASPGDILSLTL
jgi:hypothetical protein